VADSTGQCHRGAVGVHVAYEDEREHLIAALSGGCTLGASGRQALAHSKFDGKGTIQRLAASGLNVYRRIVHFQIAGSKLVFSRASDMIVVSMLSHIGASYFRLPIQFSLSPFDSSVPSAKEPMWSHLSPLSWLSSRP
jgi:hypothetical protein